MGFTGNKQFRVRRKGMNYLFTGIYFLLIVPLVIYFFQKYRKQLGEEEYNKKLTIILVIIVFLGIYIFNKTEIMTVKKFFTIIRYSFIFLGLSAVVHTKYNENKDEIDKLIEKYYLITIVPTLIGTTLIGLIIN